MEKTYADLLKLLNRLISLDEGNEKDVTANKFVEKWDNDGAAIQFDSFLAYLKEHEDFSGKSEELDTLLENGVNVLQSVINNEDDDFSKAVQTYFEELDNQESASEKQMVMNDILAYRSARKQAKEAGQKVKAKTFQQQIKALMKEQDIDKEALVQYARNRQDALLKLFGIADVMSQTTNRNSKATLEAQFCELASPYGFVSEDMATTSEFNEEYVRYSQNPDEYSSHDFNDDDTKDKQQDTSEYSEDDDDHDDEYDDEDDFDNDDGYEFHDQVHIFPITDHERQLSEIIPAESYTDALVDYLKQHEHKLSFGIDFETQPIDFEKIYPKSFAREYPEEVSVSQNYDIEGWNIFAHGPLTWNTSQKEIEIRDSTITAKNAVCQFGTIENSKIAIDREKDEEYYSWREYELPQIKFTAPVIDSVVEAPVGSTHFETSSVYAENTRFIGHVPAFPTKTKAPAKIAKQDNSDDEDKPKKPIIIDNSVFRNCTFQDFGEEFYSSNLTGTKFVQARVKKVTKTKDRYDPKEEYSYKPITGQIEGEAAGFSHREECLIDYICRGSLNATGMSITDNCKIKFTRNHGARKSAELKIDKAFISDSAVEFILKPSDNISAKDMTAKKAVITIADVSKVDFENATFTDCEITISNVDEISFKNATFQNCTVKIDAPADRWDTEEREPKASIDFTDASINGETSLLGVAKSIDCTEANLGSGIRESRKRSTFDLESKKMIFTKAAFGNVNIAGLPKNSAKETDWKTVKIIGHVRASGEAARMLFPKFKNAVNFAEEEKPQHATRKDAQPSRTFDLE